MRNFAYTEKSEFINPRLTEHSKVMEQAVYQTGENVYSAVGFGLCCPVMVVGDDGIIIIDPAETIAMMQAVMAEFRKISDKPVSAVIVSHNHGDHWGGMTVCVNEEQSKKKQVLVIVDETFMHHYAQASGELLDIRMGRAVWMYGSLLQKGEQGYVNLGSGPVLSKGANAFVMPNTFVPVKDGLKLTISGVAFELFHCEAETEDAICVFLPKEKIIFVGDAIQGEIFPNIYTIRGTVRDAKKWYTGIDVIRKYKPHHLVGTHMRPLHGEKECEALLTDYRDAIQYTHDQAVRMINRGYTPDYALEKLGTLPPHLYQRERLGEFYGTFKQGVKAVYDLYLGWFNGEPSKLNPIPPQEAAKKYLQSMGGRTAVIAQAKKAIVEKEYAWATELLSYPIRVDPQDMEARSLKANAVRELGYATENATWRNWYLTCAIALEGGFEALVKQVGPNAGFPPFSNSFIGLSAQVMFESIKAKIDGIKAQDVQKTLRAMVSDTDEAFLITIRRGIVEVSSANQNDCAEIALSADKLVWAKLITKEMDVQTATEHGAVCSDTQAATAFFNYFEGFTPFTEMPFWLQ